MSAETCFSNKFTRVAFQT